MSYWAPASSYSYPRQLFAAELTTVLLWQHMGETLVPASKTYCIDTAARVKSGLTPRLACGNILVYCAYRNATTSS